MTRASNESIAAVYEQVFQLELELAEAKRIIAECLMVTPVGYVPNHTPENLPAKIKGLVKELAENTTIRHARVAEELTKVTEQRDAAIAALETIASLDFPMPYLMHAVMDIANKALNKIKL